MDGLDPILEEDLEYLEDILSQFGPYRFSEDLQRRMEEQGISSAALAKRCGLSHTIIDKWRTDRAHPNGKERLKELGMALGMDCDALNSFLLSNGFPRLYVKNPLDSAARLLLLRCAGIPDIVELYRQLTERLGLGNLPTGEDENPLATTVMSLEFHQAAQSGDAGVWFENRKGQFRGDGKTLLPDARVKRYLSLYLGDVSIRELAITGELPTPLKGMLYSIFSGKPVTVRFLRDKLIAFGLYTDMTEEEINVLLQCMRLQPISEPATALDMAVLSALRSAHERYPLYEYESLLRITQRITPPQSTEDSLLLEQYSQRLRQLKQFVEYYESHTPSAEEGLFEQYYTSYTDRGVMDYVRDLLLLLSKRGSLPENETLAFVEYIKRAVS